MCEFEGCENEVFEVKYIKLQKCCGCGHTKKVGDVHIPGHLRRFVK